MLKLMITEAHLWWQHRLHSGRAAKALLHLRELVLVGKHSTTVHGLHEAATIHLWSRSPNNARKSAHVEGRHLVVAERTCGLAPRHYSTKALRRWTGVRSHG